MQAVRRALCCGPLRVLTILDWDDTLFCTSYVRESLQFTGRFPSRADRPFLESIGASVRALVELLRAQGPCCIVTNARRRWVRSVVLAFLPGLLGGMPPVHSARDLYERRSPGNPCLWKLWAFRDVHRRYVGGRRLRDVLVIGDGEAELYALRRARSGIRHRFSKVVMMKTRPTAQELAVELAYLRANLMLLLAERRDVAIRIERAP